MKPHKTLLEWLDGCCPPFIAVALARKRGFQNQWISVEEIAKTSGISVRTARRVAREVTWAKHLKHASAFLEACNISPFDMRPHRRFLRDTMNTSRPFSHIPDHYRTTFLRHFAAKCKVFSETKRREP